MNFDLSDEQRLLQESVGRLLEDLCPPQRVRDVAEEGAGFDQSLWDATREIGVAGLASHEVFGGAGLEILDLACIAETLGYHAAPGPFLGHALASRAIALAGSDAQKERWLPTLAQGEAIATVALAEEGGAWQPEQWRMLAGDRLTGTKTLVPDGAHADLIVVGLAGGRFGLVEGGSAGLGIAPVDTADLTRRVDRLDFDACACDLLPADATHVGTARRVVDTGLILLAADAFGGAQRLLHMCVEYAKTREQFGVKIGSFQALKHELADTLLQVEPNRGLYWYAAYLHDACEADAARVAAIAKAHNSDRFMQVARTAVEVHGGIGFTWECDTQIWFKRAMFDRAFLGAPREHRRRQAELAGW